MVSGGLPLRKETVISDKGGIPVEWKQGETFPLKESYSLCRCGQSKNQPFCDGTHLNIGFNGSETSGHVQYADQVKTITGPGLALKDAEKLCSLAMFCHRHKNTWNLTRDSSCEESKNIAIQEACDCPSGRLVACDKQSGKPIEPHFEPSLGLIEDPARKASGPLWVKGGVPIESSNGLMYEVRNRVTLCRCGKSKNKPFCDGSHIAANFKDRDSSVE